MTTFTTANELYQRQITLLGKEAQDKISQTKILVVGVGGLGCPALQYLCSSGIGTIGVADFDKVSISNLQRQILFKTQDIGKKKVRVAIENLKQIAPFCHFKEIDMAINQDNASQLVRDYDIVLDCTDNFRTKFILHDTCFQQKKIFIMASVYQYEGQLHLFDFREQKGPCLRCLWPIEPKDGCTGTCAQVGVMAPLLGVLGSMQAMEALKVIVNKSYLKNEETAFVDLIDFSLEKRSFKALKGCICCEKKESVLSNNYQIILPENLSDYQIIDVRSRNEFLSCKFIENIIQKQKIMNIPLEDISQFIPQDNIKYLMICARGVRSLKACEILRKNNVEVFSLIGGIQNFT
ncbi:MAG: ThiF family adenylyltransferase [Bacteriovoracaceae bacterium]